MHLSCDCIESQHLGKVQKIMEADFGILFDGGDR